MDFKRERAFENVYFPLRNAFFNISPVVSSVFPLSGSKRRVLTVRDSDETRQPRSGFSMFSTRRGVTESDFFALC